MTAEGRIGGKLEELPPRQRKSQGSLLDSYQPWLDLERVLSKGLAPNTYEGVVFTPEAKKKLGKSVARRATIRLRREYTDFPYDVERRSLPNGNEEVLVKYPPERVIGKHTPVVQEMPTGSSIKRAAKQRTRKPANPHQEAQSIAR